MSRFSYVFFLLSVFLYTSCGSRLDVRGLVNKAKRIEVVKTDAEGTSKGRKTVLSTDSIGQLLSVVSNTDAPSQVACDYDYEYRCFDDESKLFFLVQLNSAHLCQGAVFEHEGEVYYRYLSDDGAEYLETLFN